MSARHIGSDFDDFLKHDGLLAECEASALKRVVAWQLEREMKRRRISRAKLASRMKTEHLSQQPINVCSVESRARNEH